MEIGGRAFPVIHQPTVVLPQRTKTAAQLGVGPKLRVSKIVWHARTGHHIILGGAANRGTAEPIHFRQLPIPRPAVLHPERAGGTANIALVGSLEKPDIFKVQGRHLTRLGSDTPR